MSEKRINWVYLFHGEDELTSREAVQGLVARMKDSPMGEYNVSSFDGEKLPGRAGRHLPDLSLHIR